MPKQRVHIVHDGESAYLTRVTNAQTGEEIPGVSAVELRFDASLNPVMATLTVYDVSLDVTVDAEVTTRCPCCRRPVEERSENE